MGLNVVCSCGSIFRVIIINQGPFNDTKTYIARCPNCGVTHTATEFEFPTVADFIENLYTLYNWPKKVKEGGE